MTERDPETSCRDADIWAAGVGKCPRMCDGWVEEFAPLSTQRDYT